MIANRVARGRVAGRRCVLGGGAALALAGCADGGIGRPPPLPPSPVAAAGTPPASVRAAQTADLVGTWQMLLLPAAVAQQVNVSPRFEQNYQWLLITSDGRIGFVATPEYPQPPIDAASLRDMFDREPNFDAFSLVGGVMTVTTPGDVGIAAKRDVWHVDVVTGPGALLGLAVVPGDVAMQLRDGAGQPVYRRIVRRI